MIRYIKGNLLEAEVEALVNTVNTKGVMGKGIALQFKKAFPAMYKVYEAACKAGEVQIGKMQVYENAGLFKNKLIINFPTKEDWRKPSEMSYIEKGLEDLARVISKYKIKSVAIPPLGCGNGGLNWVEVKAKIEIFFQNNDNIDILVYEPAGAPVSEKIINRTVRPHLTKTRAIVIKLFQQYSILGYELTLLEIQKLLYFLQEYGETLKLRFEKKYYGPYADNLRHVLNQFEGHFTSGFADGNVKPNTPIKLLPDAVKEADEFLRNLQEDDDTHIAKLKNVENLIKGYETPYGLELLSTVHWLIKHDKMSSEDKNSLVKAVHDWNPRKAKLMKPEHINAALERLVHASPSVL